MLLVLSPSKTLDFESKPPIATHTLPQFLDEAEQLVEQLKQYQPAKLAQMMDISEKLAQLNVQRYRDFHLPFTSRNAKQALFAFKGDVYEGIETETYTREDCMFAQKHVRILSGLYGLLRPLDLIQPYRLEMGTRLANDRGKDLYAFWGNRISEALNEAMPGRKDRVLINLASEEYFKAVHPKVLDARILNIVFKEHKQGNLKVIGLFAKQARGLMANFIVKHRLTDKIKLKEFNEYGYQYNASLSSADRFVFVR